MEKTTEEKIIEAGMKEFGQYGFDGARIDRIAKKAKVNKAMIYYHYKGKEALYEAILSEMYVKVSKNVLNTLPNDKNPTELIQMLISKMIDFIQSLDKDIVKIILRELSSGGKYFKKIMIPNLFLPAFGRVQEIFKQGLEENYFKDLNPYYSFLQILGSIVFFNAIRITLEDTDIGKLLFKDDYFEKFKINLLTIIKSGIEKSKEAE